MSIETTPHIHVLIFNDVIGTRVLLYQNDSDHWQLPSTTMQIGETAFEAAVRAAKDQAGIILDLKRCTYGQWHEGSASNTWRTDSGYSCFVVYRFNPRALKTHNDRCEWFPLNRLPFGHIMPESTKQFYLNEATVLRKKTNISLVGITLVSLMCVGYGALHSASILPFISTISQFIGIQIGQKKPHTHLATDSLADKGKSTQAKHTFTSSCPRVDELQKVINDHTIKPGGTQSWTDPNGVEWQISVPQAVKAPPIVINFYQANWTNTFTLFCGYSSQGSDTAIFANGQFNAERPYWQPWLSSPDQREAVCRGNPQNCTFQLIKTPPGIKQPFNQASNNVVTFRLGKQLGFQHGVFSIMQGKKQLGSTQMDAGNWNEFHPDRQWVSGDYEICFSGTGSAKSSIKKSSTCACRYNFSVRIGTHKQIIVLSRSSLSNWSALSPGACGNNDT